MPKRQVDISWVKGRGEETEQEDPGIFAGVAGQVAAPPRDKRVLLVDPKSLLDNPYQHRMVYRNIESLAGKIQQFGFRGSIPVRLHPDRPGMYEIAYGHRRKRAAEIAGVPQVPVEVEELTDEQMILLAMSENYEREDLTPLEEGNGFLQLNEEFGMSQEAIASFVGEEKKDRIDRGYVRNRMRAAKLARKYPEVQSFLEQHPGVGVGYLRAIGYLEEEGLGEREVAFILERLDQDGWTADTVAAAVKILKEGGEGAETLLNAKQIAPARAAAEHPQDGHSPSSSAQDGTAPDTDRPPLDERALALKRSGQVTDALKRVRRYTHLIGDALPSQDERSALKELLVIIQQILARS